MGVSKSNSLKKERQKGHVKVRICTPGNSCMRSCSFILPCVQDPQMNFLHAAHLIFELSPKAVGISIAPQNGMSHICSNSCSTVGSSLASCNDFFAVPCLVCILTHPRAVLCVTPHLNRLSIKAQTHVRRPFIDQKLTFRKKTRSGVQQNTNARATVFYRKKIDILEKTLSLFRVRYGVRTHGVEGSRFWGAIWGTIPPVLLHLQGKMHGRETIRKQ